MATLTIHLELAQLTKWPSKSLSRKLPSLLPFKRIPNFIKYDRQVLSFSAYLSEAVFESAVESDRIRYYTVFYFAIPILLEILLAICSAFNFQYAGTYKPPGGPNEKTPLAGSKA